MSGKFLARASALSLALILAACGGDDSSTPLAGSGGNGGTGGNNGGENPTQVEIGSINLLTDRPQIGTSGNNSATITAVVLDRNNTVVADAPVQFSVMENAELSVLSPLTDEEGRVRAQVSAGADPSNRTISVRAVSGNQSGSVNIQVTGTSINLTGSTSIALNDAVTFTSRLTDSDGEGIQGVTVTPSSSLGNEIEASSLTTDSAGLVRFTLNASRGGNEVVSVEAYSGTARVLAQQEAQISTDSFQFTLPERSQEIELGASETVRVLWQSEGTPVPDGEEVQFSTTRGTLTPADGIVTTSGGVAEVTISSNNVGPATITARGVDGGPTSQRSVEFVSSTPDAISVQADKTQIGINSSATITATVRDVNDNLVKNAQVRFELTDITGGQISVGSVITNSQGRAETTYTSSSTTSSSGGVLITAIIDNTIQDQIALTVGGDALRINIGTGNEIDDNDLTRYRAPWTVFVTDSNGNAVSGKSVNISVVPTRFFKGQYQEAPSGSPRFQASYEAMCASEDVDNNGILTEAKDINGNDRLDPIPSATVPGTVSTQEDGTADFTLTYPKSECNWVEVQLSASTSVGGTESRASQKFILACTVDDLNDAPPGGSSSPYGTTPGCDNDL